MSEHSEQQNDVVLSGVSSDVSRVTGCVKWFNNKAGYGFITVSTGPHVGDVFVHHSAINVNEEQYRFLVQGEYVEFNCVSVEGGPHQWQASNVTGPGVGKLMCETRRTTTRPVHEGVAGDSREYRQPRSDSEYRPLHTRSRLSQQAQGSGAPPPRSRPHHSGDQAPAAPNDGYEWLLVRRHAEPSSRHSSHSTRPPSHSQSTRPRDSRPSRRPEVSSSSPQ